MSLELEEEIRRRIRAEGPITFAEFMEMALYHPGLGYYTRPGRGFGREGDFYTSVHVHPIFGAMLALQLREMWYALGRPRPFILVECGAGEGFLAKDILEATWRRWPEFFTALRYGIVERSPYLTSVQKERLAGSGRPAWFESLSEAAAWAGEPLTGCLLANELIDAFPVHRVRLVGGRMREIYVALDGERFVEVLGELSGPELAAYFDGLSLEEGQEAEANLEALRWLEEVAQNLARGFTLILDYGYRAEELYGPRFPRGTLMCYRKHQAGEDPYRFLGEQDLTAHVNFSALIERGRELGLKTLGFTTQMEFLLSLGILEEAARWDEGSARLTAQMAAKRLIMPGGMGEIFKVLIQYKGPGQPRLKGLARPW